MMANLIIDHHHHHICIITITTIIIVAGPHAENKSRGVSARWQGRSQLHLNIVQPWIWDIQILNFMIQHWAQHIADMIKKWCRRVMQYPMCSPTRSPKHKLKMRSSITFPDWLSSIACPWRSPMWRKSFHENSNWFPIVPEECLNVRWNHCQHVNIFSWEQIFLFSRPHHHRYSALLSRRGKITKTYKTVWRWGPDGQNLPTNLANISEQKSKFHSRNAVLSQFFTYLFLTEKRGSSP